METEIKEVLNMYNVNSINLGELYIKLMHLNGFGTSVFESFLHKHASALTLFLLLTYQKSQSLN